MAAWERLTGAGRRGRTIAPQASMGRKWSGRQSHPAFRPHSPDAEGSRAEAAWQARMSVSRYVEEAIRDRLREREAEPAESPAVETEAQISAELVGELTKLGERCTFRPEVRMVCWTHSLRAKADILRIDFVAELDGRLLGIEVKKPPEHSRDLGLYMVQSAQYAAGVIGANVADVPQEWIGRPLEAVFIRTEADRRASAPARSCIRRSSAVRAGECGFCHARTARPMPAPVRRAVLDRMERLPSGHVKQGLACRFRSVHSDLMSLQADSSELSQFVQVLFRYAHPGSFVSLRSFDQGDDKSAPFEISGHQINGSLEPIVQAAGAAAYRAANNERPVVFAPPIATFTNARRASVGDLANGLVLSVELDEGNSVAALRRLESILGFATCVVESGSTWIDPETGEITPKVHMHWRLSEPTTTQDEHAKLREARNLAALLVGADPTGKPVVHPLRWPGSWNRKQTPRMARISAIHEAAEINLDDALERLREAIEAAGVSQTPVGTASSGKPQAAPDLVLSAMHAVPNPDLHYDEWIRLGYATMRAMGDDERAFETFDVWSRKSGKYQEAETVAAWRRIHRAILAESGAGHGWRRHDLLFRSPRRLEVPGAEAPKPPEDPGWWHSLEQSLLEDQSVAEVAEVRAEVSQQQPPHNFRDGLVINPPIHWTAPAPLREWLIEESIPIGYVTGLYGDGGIGKSLIAQQLLTSTSLAMPWLGLNVVGGRAFGFMCEDDASELHRRQEGINRNYGIEMMNLEYLRIAAETRVRQPSDDVRPGKSGSTHRPLH